MKSNRGEITIQLVIMVIALIILGGVCVFMLTGENGLFVPKGQEPVNANNTSTTNQTENTTNSTNEIENGALTVPME